mgnify:CR=1 FL=1
MNEEVRVFKLSNGDNIVGSIFDNDDLFDFNKPLQISYPLKMVIIGRMTNNGPQESLSLSPWVHPMTESEYIDVNSKNIIMSAPASSSLTKYYTHCVNQFDFVEEPYHTAIGPTDEELKEIELQEELDDIENALDELTDPIDSKTIH